MGEETANDFWGGWADAKLMNMDQWQYVVDNAYIPDRKQVKLVESKRIKI
jgi:hypothetical protein